MDEFLFVEMRTAEMKGLPVVVGGRQDPTRGLVSAASYEARNWDQSARPLVTAESSALCDLSGWSYHKKFGDERSRATIINDFRPWSKGFESMKPILI